MDDRRTIGQILMDFGRITEEDCVRALEVQRDRGGYFGEALLALGRITQEELEWSLAEQYDLPYIFPDAESIDPEAAALVSPEWALAHLTLPIMKTDDALTVVVESPLATSAVDELRGRTELRIELAVASPLRIRELIRQVYARGTAVEPSERPLPMHLTEALAEALEAAAARFGISTRGHRSWAWWDDGGTVRRRPLEGLWESELRQLLVPPPGERILGVRRAQWDAHLHREGMVTPVEVRYLFDESGHEYLFRPVNEASAPQDRFAAPSAGIVSEIRLLARSGSARFVVTAEPDTLGHEILPHLPALLLDPSWRSIYISASEQPAGHEAFSVRMPEDPGTWAAELETLRAFHFDVVTVDLSRRQDEWAGAALDVASVAFLLWPMSQARRSAYEAGIRWELHIERAPGNTLDWSLDPLHA
jgi:MshEN domain